MIITNLMTVSLDDVFQLKEGLLLIIAVSAHCSLGTDNCLCLMLNAIDRRITFHESLNRWS